MNKILNLPFVIGAAVVLCLIIIAINSGSSPRLGSGTTFGPVQAFSTSTSVTVTTSDTLVLATSSATYKIISNGGPNSIWLDLTGSGAVINKGILLAASSTYESSVEKGNAVYGAIRAISAGASSAIVGVAGY